MRIRAIKVDLGDVVELQNSEGLPALFPDTSFGFLQVTGGELPVNVDQIGINGKQNNSGLILRPAEGFRLGGELAARFGSVGFRLVATLGLAQRRSGACRLVAARLWLS